MRKLVFSLAALPLFCGCAGLQRPFSDAALGAGGAYIANELSDGNPLATAGGAAGGVLLSEGAHAWKAHSDKKAFEEGYTVGRSDGIKKIYWSLQDQQRSSATGESYQVIEVTIPEHWENGVLVKQTKRLIRIME
jgi:hypothetical protein